MSNTELASPGLFFEGKYRLCVCASRVGLQTVIFIWFVFDRSGGPWAFGKSVMRTVHFVS